ncbi:regulator of nonsense transcripts 3B [Leptopilina heterotoma]|uniref:regulator of nonsense transcripts 3B n=1 Tax=Leptopilina heterotoma TaxID=63436 RepID=UPI001CAA1555|nr:regulator of nonsense transcripts 3B [Leptopilina heterotoma]
MTEESQQSEKTAQSESSNTRNTDIKLKDTKKEKCRPMTKVVVRRLPPSMTQEQFVEQISPLPDYDYLYFVKADMSLGQYAFSRAYINFLNQQDIFIFREKFDNYVFVDSKGTEYPAVVEFAPFQRLPKKRVGKKKDLKCGTIETDAYFINFLESLKNQESDSGTSQPKTEYSYQPAENTPKKVTTPLLDYLKQRKQERQRLRDEKREERRRRDLERRRAKDESTVSKVLKNPDSEREANKNKENKEEREKNISKDVKTRNKRDDKFRDKLTRDRDGKLPAKSYRDREEKFKDRDMKYQKKHDERKSYGKKEERDNFKERMDDRRSESRDERKFENREDNREFKERKAEEKKGKSYEKMRQEKRRLSETKKQNLTENSVEISVEKVKIDETPLDVKSESNEQNSVEVDQTSLEGKDICEKESANIKIPDKEEEKEEEPKFIADEKPNLENTERLLGSGDEKSPVNCPKSKSNEEIDKELDYCGVNDPKKETVIVKRRSSLESGGEGGGGDGACLRRHKSLDGEDQGNLQKNVRDEKVKNKKDPRLERRIRNKDRPTMEIYRPGMGKFSKQRIEREKSTNDERASLSQSPTPTGNVPTTFKNNKSGSEVRSMTFKRSVSRDIP